MPLLLIKYSRLLDFLTVWSCDPTQRLINALSHHFEL